MVELPLDRRQIVKDVGVIELQVVQHGRARAVVHELAALVEKRRVVLVGLNHEQWPLLSCRQRPQARRDAEVHGHAADQKAGRQARAFQNPGQHRGGGGLAMRAGHGQHMAAGQHLLGQPLRAAGIGRARVQNGLHQREFRAAIGQPGAADHVADDEHVGRQRQLLGAIALDQLYAQRAQLVAHRRVDAAVAAGDAVTRLARQGGQAAHESAANA